MASKTLTKKNIKVESYTVHYPSLKKLTQLQYTDPRVNTEGKKIHVEKEGNFRQGNCDCHGHYVVYEDKGFPGTYIGVHVGSEINEESGEIPVSVIAMDKNRSAVINRVQYRMRQSKVVESEVMEETTMRFGRLKKGQTFGLPDDPDSATLIKVSDTHYQVNGKGGKYKLNPGQEVFPGGLGK